MRGALGQFPRFVSQPVKIHWAGWETDTLRLQQAGWQLSAEQDVLRDTLRLAIKHDQLGIRGITDLVEFKYLRGHPAEPYWEQRSGLQMRMASQIVIHTHGPFTFSAIDAEPAFEDRAVTRLDDIAHFRGVPMARTQALVLPEATVDDLLAEILERQQEAKVEYFRDMVAREGAALPAHTFHAQIISFPKAA